MNMSKDLMKVSIHFNPLCVLILWRFDFDI